MATPQLSVVGSAVETPGERIRRLQNEARLAALEQMSALDQRMAELSAMAREIVAGGDAFPVGVRELCRNLSEDLSARSQMLSILLLRSRGSD